MNFTDIALGKLIFNLEIISGLQKGETLDTTNEYLRIVPISYISSFARTFSGDSREKGLMRARTYINMAYEYAERILESKYLTIYERENREIRPEDLDNYIVRISALQRISSAIKNSMNGIINFSITYRGKNDQDVVGSAQELIKDIEQKYKLLDGEIDRLEKIKEEYEYIGELRAEYSEK